MADIKVYCPGCRKWYHLIGKQQEVDAIAQGGCHNCGSKLIDSEIMVKPGVAELLEANPPSILYPPGIESLQDNERPRIDYSDRILKLVFGNDGNGLEGDLVGSE